MAKKPVNPLELPELLHNILAHLSDPDLVRIMHVSRNWYAETSRLLWKTVVFTDNGSVEQGEKVMRRLTEFTRVCGRWKEEGEGLQGDDGWGRGERRDSLGSVGELVEGEKKGKKDVEEEEEEAAAAMAAAAEEERREEKRTGGEEGEEEDREVEHWQTKESRGSPSRGNRQKSSKRRFIVASSVRFRQLVASRLSSIITGDGSRSRKRAARPTQNYASLIRTLSIRKVKDPILNKLLQSAAPNTRCLNTLELYICDFIQDATILAFVDAGLRTLDTSSSSSSTTNTSSSSSSLSLSSSLSSSLSHISPSVNTFLTNISVPGCSCITDVAVTYIAKRCPALEVLDLRACSAVTDASLTEIAARCPRLGHINVGRIKDRGNITIKSIAALAKGTSLRVLGLAGCDITDECMAVLAEYRGRDIERISVNHCPDITNVSLRAFLKACPRLTVFEMKACTSLNDWPAIAELARRNVLLSLSESQQAELEEWGARNGLVIFLKKPFRGRMA